MRDALSGLSGVVTDAAVPEAHRGLHASLYGDGGAEAHAADAAYSARAVRAPIPYPRCAFLIPEP